MSARRTRQAPPSLRRMSTAVLWLRRDPRLAAPPRRRRAPRRRLRRPLRLADAPSLLAAADSADEVLPLFVLDDALRGPSGAPRLAFLYRCLRELEERTDGRLRLRTGRPEGGGPRGARGAAG